MPETSQPWLLSFTLDDWAALGGQVSLSLVDRVGILVGRNGAGKSAILEGFDAISSWATGRINRARMFDSDSIPKKLDIEVLTPADRLLRYKFELVSLPTSIDNLASDVDDSTSDASEEVQFSCNESCQYVDGKNELLWITEAGITTFYDDDEEIGHILGNTYNLLRARISERSGLKLPSELQWIHAVLRGVRLLGKAPIRQTLKRRSSYLRVSSKGVSPNVPFGGLPDTLSRKVLRLQGTGELDELEAICQRIGLGSKIDVQRFVLSDENIVRSEDEEYFIASVLLDGVNVGLLSDGTLRILSILMEILSPPSNATTMIEEPEAQIHPGMLEKLLNEIEAYTSDGNLILSTHSPQVVAWTQPEKLNLVYRQNGHTTVQKLKEKEIQTVISYLNEEGSLGDWLYSGILDE